MSTRLRETVGALAGLLLATVVWIGAPSVVAAQAPADAAAAFKYLHSLAEHERLQVLKREAKREGKAVVYGALGIDRAQILIKLFNESYPDVKIDFIRLTLNELAEKIMLEGRSGRAGADVVITGSDWFGVVSSALGPYEPSAWSVFDPKFRHGSFDQGWTGVDYEILPEAIAWRTDRVKPGEAPKSLDDIADAKWKGRLGTVTNLERVVDRYQALYGEAQGMAKIQALAANQSRLYSSIGALASALGTGEIDVAWGVGAYRAIGLKSSGAPVDFVFAKPTFAFGLSVSVAKGAQHPYAGALFMEFLTLAETLEKIDKTEPGRLFGHTKGNFVLALKDFPGLIPFESVSPARFRELNRIVDQYFFRR